MTSHATPFPWEQLPRFPRSRAGLEGEAVACVSVFRPERLAVVLRELFAVELEGSGVTEAKPCAVARLSGADVQLKLRDGGVQLSVQPELAGLLLSRLMQRPIPVLSGTPLSEGLRGAWHASVLEVLRRVCDGEPPLIAGAQPSGSRAFQFEFWIRLDGRSFRGWVVVTPDAEAKRAMVRDVPLQLPLVMARVVCERAELCSLQRGDVLLPDGGWFVDQQLCGTLVAIAPSATRGFQLVSQGSGEAQRLVFGGLTHLEHDMEQDEANQTQQDTALEAPVVVRIEVGTISLSAREWMGLQRGDVLATAKRIGSPVVLRSGGTELAQGELVDVEGELGVRVTRLLNEGPV